MSTFEKTDTDIRRDALAFAIENNRGISDHVLVDANKFYAFLNGGAK